MSAWFLDSELSTCFLYIISNLVAIFLNSNLLSFLILIHVVTNVHKQLNDQKKKTTLPAKLYDNRADQRQMELKRS